MTTEAAPRPFAVWLEAIRPQTLALSVVPVVVGTALAYAHDVMRLGPALAAALGAVLIQIGTNLYNDYGDFQRGADTPERLGPPRATARGWLTPRQVLVASVVAFVGAAMAGVFLVVVAGWPILAVGILSILCGIAYTGGPLPLAYIGAGDVFVFVFFGLVAVGGTYWVQAQSLTGAALLCGCGLGALSTCVLVVNNLRDQKTDARAGKRTLVVRFGETVARIQYVALVVVAYAVPILAWQFGLGDTSWLWALLTLPLAVFQGVAILQKSGADLNPHLGGTARVTLLYGATLAVGVAW